MGSPIAVRTAHRAVRRAVRCRRAHRRAVRGKRFRLLVEPFPHCEDHLVEPNLRGISIIGYSVSTIPSARHAVSQGYKTADARARSAREADAPDGIERVEREVPQAERDKVDVGQLRAGREERFHELHGQVPAIHDAAGEEGREEDDAVDPLRSAARVARLIEESALDDVGLRIHVWG